MKIAVDLRSLSSDRISGVENYSLNMAENLPMLDRQNSYTFFYNSLRRRKLPEFHYVNSQVRKTNYPNKLLNLAFKFSAINLEKIIGQVDCVFMPNLNQFSISNKTKLAITVHDLSPIITPEFYDIKRKLWHKFLNYKKAFERADILLAVSEYTKNDLIKIFNINPEKIKVIYPGVEQKFFNQNIPVDELRLARNIYALPGDYILFLNTIEPRKNLANLVKAFEKLKSNTNLVIAGRLGWKYSRDFELIKRSKKSAKIKYIGYVAPEHKPAVIKLAKALVYPSFYEGFGFQPLEAMALGTPVIASRLTSLPEVVADSGLLINPYSADDITEALETVLNNELLTSQLIAKAIKRSADFTWVRAADQTLEAINSL